MATPQQVMQALAKRRNAAGASLTRQVKKQRNAEPYIYYDTRILSNVQQPGDTAANTFALIVNPMSFFAGRTEGTHGIEVTNAEDSNKLGAAFLAQEVSIDVHCDTDCASAAGIATARAFVETVCNMGIFALYFGTYRKFVAPVLKFPSGGGVFSGSKIRTQAAAANSDSEGASNGFPSAQARAKLPEPILFARGSAFRAEIRYPTTALARLIALQALTANFEAIVRVNLHGVRGSMLMPGTPG